MGKAISAVMQRAVTRVHMDDTIDSVEASMKAHRVSSAPVCGDGGAVIGIITTTDLVRHHAAGKDSRAAKAWELCSYNPLHVTPDTPASKVAELMIEHRVHHVLVMNGRVAEGIVSALDFVKLYLDECRS